MSKTISDREIEALLQPHIGTDQSSRGRFLAVMEILRVFSNEKEGLTAKEIARIIGKRCGKAPSENSVLSDLSTLAANPPFGMEIKAASRGDKTGFRCIQRFVSPDEASVLINLVKTCKFMTPGQRDELSSKLLETIPLEKQDEVVETVFVDERQTSSFVNVFEAANVSSRAIREGRGIRFKYVYRQMNGNFIEREIDDEEPVALIYSFGHYYLETCGPECDLLPDGVRFRRLDHMKDVVVEGRIKRKRKVDRLSRAVIKNVSERLDMFGDGVCRVLFLRVQGSHAKYVYDRFGNNVRFEHVDEEAAVGYVCIRTQLSPTLLRWLFGMAPKISLQRPKGLTWIRRFDGFSHANEALLQSALSDYSEAVECMMSQVEQLLSCYSDENDIVSPII